MGRVILVGVLRIGTQKQRKSEIKGYVYVLWLR
jgi:hypothetical protein